MRGLRYAEVSQRELKFLDMTSLTVEEFGQVVPGFEEALQERMNEWRLDGKRRSGRGYTTYANCPLPTPEDRLLFILVYLKTNVLQVVQGELFGIKSNISCAASSATLVPYFVVQAQAAGWKVCVITTPQGTEFIDIPLLTQLTGYPVRSQYKRPEEPDVLPRADAIVVFPATFNTINKWALGISDTLALGLLCEYTGLKMPIVTVPCFRTGGGLDGHPAFFRSLQMLRDYGVRVLYEPDKYPPKNQVPPKVILEVLDETIRKHAQSKNRVDTDSY